MATQQELIKELFSYLDYTEESDLDRIFHPIQISCTRVMMMGGLNKCLKDLKKTIEESNERD